MKFKKVFIENFRNFEKIEVNISNKNIFFGLNDIGKTNFLYAMRYVFDRNTRRNGFLDSDFHKKNVKEPIKITVVIDISDIDDSDNQKLRSQLKGAIRSNHTDVFIQLIAEYNAQDLTAMPIMYWGDDQSHLYEIKQRGYSYDIDRIFNVIYIDSYVDLYSLFKKNIASLIKSDNTEDDATLEHIQTAVNELNTNISNLSGVKEFEEKITPEYQQFRNENISISVKSEIAVKGLYSNIVPYIKQTGDENLYPTAGEGRKKLLTYSIYDLLSKENEESKINLFLIEEPENHLHRSLQIALSQILFAEGKYRYLFVTTHSPFILYDMDGVSLIRIFHGSSIDSSSYFYQVPSDFEKNRKMLNRNLAEAIFANKVLLVEGPSELLLFDRVLSVIQPSYEANGMYILPVGGVGFTSYCEIFDALKIKWVVKTDNDLKRSNSKNKKDCIAIGFQRCNRIIGKNILPEKTCSQNDPTGKRALYDENKDALDTVRKDNGVFLSKVDLENDLDEVLPNELCEYLDTGDPVSYLQAAKRFHMVELVQKLTDDDCKTIFEHYNFACLKEITK
ncbi:ATP-dependent endonuclease [uncultured Bifidobacterium sp.]|uniref:ATP-dependent nuclease n=1 Tax=uncultured Bifidobacterium sp. TaxID=165187 RepID=UPI00258EF84D|nr:AAA family ATPase [uncultured Bifidobacterium sp.]